MGPWSEAAAAAGHFLDGYGLAAIFLVMLLKEAGIPIPIPGDLIMLAAAAQSAAGKYQWWEAFGAIMIAVVVGAWVQYLLVRELGRPFLRRVGPRLGLPEERLDRAADVLRKGGAAAVALSLLTPGVRVATVPACALASLPYRSFFPGLVTGSAAFLALHFVLGYFGGTLVSNAMQAVNLPAIALAVVLLLGGMAGWMAMRRGRPAGAGGADDTVERLADWADAACPACLALGAVHRLRHQAGP